MSEAGMSAVSPPLAQNSKPRIVADTHSPTQHARQVTDSVRIARETSNWTFHKAIGDCPSIPVTDGRVVLIGGVGFFTVAAENLEEFRTF
jgi:hypothetical protein